MTSAPHGSTSTTKVAVFGSGNIGSDLMMKVIRLSETLAMVGIDPASDSRARAERLGIPTGTRANIDEVTETRPNEARPSSSEPGRPPDDHA